MAIFIANQFPDSLGAVLSLLTEMLVSAGWTYKSSGDGLAAFNSNGKVFTNTGSGALGWNNQSAWARLADPANVREFVFYRDGTRTVRFKYSRLAKFTGGSATTMPTATDERYIAGTASTASSTWTANGVQYRSCVFYGMAQSTAPYGFWFAGGDAYRGIARTAFVVDPVRSVPTDPDPYVYLFNGCTNPLPNVLSWSFFFFDTNDTSIMAYNGGITFNTREFPYAVMSSSSATTSYVPVCAAAYYSSQVTSPRTEAIGYHGTGSYNPFDSSMESYPLLYQRPIATPLYGVAGYTGVKGWSTLCRWTNTPRLNWDVANNKTLISVGSIWLPWDGATTPLGF